MKLKFIKEFLEHGTVVSHSDRKILIGWGKSEKHSYPTPDARPHLYFPGFFLEESRPWHLFENNLQISVEEFVECLLPFAERKVTRVWVNPYKELFRSTLDDIRRRIYLEELQKAVPFIYEISPSSMTESQLAASLIQACELMHKYPLNLYGLWQKNEGILGLTPEILCSIHSVKKKWHVNCFALAGTRDLLHRSSMEADPKIWQEHDIVRIGIMDALKGLGKISTGSPEEMRLPTFIHLKTLISLEMEQAPYIPFIIGRLHPTPALGAFPRKQGLHWLKQYQTLINRKKFGAPVGYVLTDMQEGNFYVAIRNVQWTSREMRIGAGCGIVAGSRFEDEWYEVHLKLQSIKKALSL